jgi:hypothetical protein
MTLWVKSGASANAHALLLLRFLSMEGPLPSRASVAGLKALACCARCGSVRFSAQREGDFLGLATRVGRNHQSQASARALGPDLGRELADHEDRAGRGGGVDATRPRLFDQRCLVVHLDPVAGAQCRRAARSSVAAYHCRIHVQRRRLRYLQLICAAHGRDVAGGNHRRYGRA